MTRVTHGTNTQNTWEAGNPKHFTGDVRLRHIPLMQKDVRARAHEVQFGSCARTHWHRHPDPQILVVLEGECWLQRWGGERTAAGTGEVLSIPANEKHWHGASRQASMLHVAIILGKEKTDWLEEVTEEQYSTTI